MIETELIDADEHHPIIRKWLDSYDYYDLNLNLMPKYGLIAKDDDEYVVAGWLFRTDGDFCLFEGCVSNPDIRRNRRKKIMDRFIKDMTYLAKKLGYQRGHIYTNIDVFAKRLLENDFKPVDSTKYRSYLWAA